MPFLITPTKEAPTEPSPDDHFDALQRFWNDITTKKFADLSSPEAALVLPKNFGWGLRNPNDTIWGFWLTDNRTPQVAQVTEQAGVPIRR